ncbi:MAG: hypothetical protein CMJ87_12030 [Planctomycetes bacterium]|nr:hypothetical protein [Planctomycetota bacterium]
MRAPWALGVVVCAVGLVGLQYCGGDGEGEQNRGAESSSVRAASTLVVPLEGIPTGTVEQNLRRDAEADAETVTLGEYWAEFWGDKWPEARAALAARGKDFSMPLKVSELPPPWESVAHEARAQLIDCTSDDPLSRRGLCLMHAFKWQEERDVSFLIQRVPGYEDELLADDDLAQRLMARLEEEHERLLEPEVTPYLEAFGVALAAKWDRGEYDYSPFSSYTPLDFEERPELWVTEPLYGGGIAIRAGWWE